MRLEAIEPADFPWFDHTRYTFSLGLTLGEVAYLSGHSASEYDPQERAIVVRGGMRDQARTAYAKIACILEATGRSLSDVVRVVEHVTVAGLDDYAAAEAVRLDVLGAAAPAVSTVAVESLLRPAALIEVEVVAGPRIVPRSATSTRRPALAAEVGETCYLSSVVPSSRTAASGDVTAQAVDVHQALDGRLAAAGRDRSDVAKVITYVTPAAAEQLKDIREVQADHLGDPGPATAWVVMSAIAGPPGAALQIEVVAARSGRAPRRIASAGATVGMRAGDVVHLAAATGRDAAGRGGDVVDQAEEAYATLLESLAAAGAGPEHLVKTVEYVTPSGLARYREVARVRERMLRAPWPASTGLVCYDEQPDGVDLVVDAQALLDSTEVRG